MEVEVKYSEALIRKATIRFWVRFIAWDGFLAVAVLAMTVAYLAISGDRTWVIGFLGGLLLLVVVIGGAVYFTYLRRALAALRQMPSQTAIFSFDDKGVSCRSDLGSSQLNWSAIVKLWRFNEVWLLFVSKGVYMTLPTDCLTDETRQLILTKLAACGSKVV